jgi:hypothetical protein
VKDANGCIAINVTVVSDAPTIVAPAAQCFEGAVLDSDLNNNYNYL